MTDSAFGRYGFCRNGRRQLIYRPYKFFGPGYVVDESQSGQVVRYVVGGRIACWLLLPLMMLQAESIISKPVFWGLLLLLGVCGIAWERRFHPKYVAEDAPGDLRTNMLRLRASGAVTVRQMRWKLAGALFLFALSVSFLPGGIWILGILGMLASLVMLAPVYVNSTLPHQILG